MIYIIRKTWKTDRLSNKSNFSLNNFFRILKMKEHFYKLELSVLYKVLSVFHTNYLHKDLKNSLSDKINDSSLDQEVNDDLE